MSLYGNRVAIGGVTCGLVLHSEAIDWSRPEVVGECVLPAGYGFTVVDIT